MAVLRPLKLVVTNWPDGHTEFVELVNNPENAADGTRQVPFSGELWIERDDFMVEAPPKYYRLTPGAEVRLRGAFFVRCTGFVADDAGLVSEVHCTYDPDTRGGNAADGRKVKSTMHWVSAQHAATIEVALYDRLFSAAVPGALTGEVFDDLNPTSRVMVSGFAEAALTGTAPGEVVQFERLGYFAHDTRQHLLFHRTVGLKDEWANIQKRSG
jgi:glutaminyl-tRNA synthetase